MLNQPSNTILCQWKLPQVRELLRPSALSQANQFGMVDICWYLHNIFTVQFIYVYIINTYQGTVFYTSQVVQDFFYQQ